MTIILISKPTNGSELIRFHHVSCLVNEGMLLSSDSVFIIGLKAVECEQTVCCGFPVCPADRTTEWSR